MLRRSCLLILCLASLVLWSLSLPPVSLADDGSTVDERFFVEELYPILRTVQCNLCHNDNGVASETELRFPDATATEEQIAAFGLKLMEFVDDDDPTESILVLKPTNREEHTGGVRIAPGSAEERVLLRWARHLASLTDRQRKEAYEKIERAERYGLEPLTIRRLTHTQYDNTVYDLLGDESHPARNFPKEDFVRGFKNQLESQGISPLQAEAYGKAAERVAASAFRGGDFRGFLEREPVTPDEPLAAGAFVNNFGLRAFRRPLAETEATRYTELLRAEAARANSFVAGARMVVETMLQSPHFLFRVERGQDGPYQQYETASRLAYFLWDTMPGDDLLGAAARGELATLAQVETMARQMLSDPRARVAMEEFLSQWMRFDQVLNATRDRRKYGQFNGELAAAMAEETRQLFSHLVWNDLDFMEFYTADYTFLNADLAQIYGLPAPAQPFMKVRYPDTSGRAGVLGHGSFLVATSKPSETSPTSRGLFVRSHFLSHEVPPPPPGVNTMLPDVTKDAPMTNRQRLEVHLNSEACASCHRLIDPIGFGFEKFDAIGGFREKMSLRFRGSRYDNEKRQEPERVELELDTAAYVQGMENSAFESPQQLGRFLAESDACQRCVVKQLFRYTFGREEKSSDQAVIDALLADFRRSGFRFRELIVAMVRSELFFERG